METVEMKIEVFNADFFTNESKSLIKIQVKSNFILKIGGALPKKRKSKRVLSV